MSDIAPSSTEGRMASQAKLAEHFDTSQMTIWRWRKKLDGFPKPIVINGRNYWSIAAVERWKASLIDAKAHQPPPQGGARGDQERSKAARKAKSSKRGEDLAEAETRPRKPRKKKASAQAAEQDRGRR
jgi:predicted DNA-binding transcriptional regulator AlpA